MTHCSRTIPNKKIIYGSQLCEARFGNRFDLDYHYFTAHVNSVPQENYIQTIEVHRESRYGQITLVPVDIRIAKNLMSRVCIKFNTYEHLYLIIEEIRRNCSESLKTLLFDGFDTGEPNDPKLFKTIRQIAPQLIELDMLHVELKDAVHIVNHCTTVQYLSVLNMNGSMAEDNLTWMDRHFSRLKTFVFYDGLNLDIGFGKFLSNNPQLENVYIRNSPAIKSLLLTKTALRYVAARIESEQRFWYLMKNLVECKAIRSMDLCFKFSITESVLRVITILDYVEGIHFSLNQNIIDLLDELPVQSKIKRLCLKGTITQDITTKVAKLFPNLNEVHIHRIHPDLELDFFRPFVQHNKKISDLYCNGVITKPAMDDLHNIRKELPNASKVVLHPEQVPEFEMPKSSTVTVDWNSSDDCLYCRVAYVPAQFPKIKQYFLNMKLD